MFEDLDALAARANRVTIDQGFIGCRVESHAELPPLMEPLVKP